MAARTRRIQHDDRTRQRIATTQLVKLLQADALAKRFGRSEAPVTLTDGRRKSIEILLRKALPDLTAVEHTGNVEQSYIVRMPAQVADLETWRAINDGYVQPNSTPASPVAVGEGTKH